MPVCVCVPVCVYESVCLCVCDLKATPIHAAHICMHCTHQKPERSIERTRHLQLLAYRREPLHGTVTSTTLGRSANKPGVGGWEISQKESKEQDTAHVNGDGTQLN